MRQNSMSDSILYHVVVVDEKSWGALVIKDLPEGHLPTVILSPHARQAEELRNALVAEWNLQVFIGGLFCDQTFGNTYYAIAELLSPYLGHRLTNVPLNQFLEDYLTDGMQGFISSYLTSTSHDDMSRAHWLDDAIHWVESVTRRRIASRSQIEQLHVGTGFCLMKFALDDQSVCWLKAVGTPNVHETTVTRFLSDAHRPTARYLPRLLAFHPGWNALLLEGAGNPLLEISDASPKPIATFHSVVLSLARLQKASISTKAQLFTLGAFDQRLQTISAKADALCDYLEVAMGHQTSSRVPQVSRHRVREILHAVEQASTCVDGLGIPTSLVHGDLNPGNILCGSRCVFIDWSEAYVGHPLVCLQHVLLLLNRIEDECARAKVRQELIASYCEEWREVIDPNKVLAATRFMPLLGAVSALYGRGDWLTSPHRPSQSRYSYARTLTRHMDRAVCALEGANA